MSEVPKRTYPIDTLSIVISALVAVYFAYSWSVDAPPADRASPEATKIWYAFDHGYKWALWICAGALIVAVLAGGAAGASAAIVRLLALAEAGLGVVFAAMAIDTLLETRAFDLTALILIILTLYCFRAARDYWRMVRNALE